MTDRERMMQAWLLSILSEFQAAGHSGQVVLHYQAGELKQVVPSPVHRAPTVPSK